MRNYDPLGNAEGVFFYAMHRERRVLLGSEEVQRTITRMAHEIVERNNQIRDLVLVGIHSRGAHLVRRLAEMIESLSGVAPLVGVIDVTPFRDDRGGTEIPVGAVYPEVQVAVDEKTVVLVDDVIYTGRTVRAALDRLNRMGKPKRIFVAILIDRGDRELPIKADIVGKNVQVGASQRVNVLLEESDGIDQVAISDHTVPGEN